jgi:hypothetical protein
MNKNIGFSGFDEHKQRLAPPNTNVRKNPSKKIICKLAKSKQKKNSKAYQICFKPLKHKVISKLILLFF